MGKDTYHDESPWLACQDVRGHLATRKLNVPTEMNQQDSRNDLQCPINLAETTAQSSQTGMQALASQSSFITIDLRRWMIPHLESHATSQARVVEVLQLEMMGESVAWQQRRFDGSVQPHVDPPTLRGVPNFAVPLGLLNGKDLP